MQVYNHDDRTSLVSYNLFPYGPLPACRDGWPALCLPVPSGGYMPDFCCSGQDGGANLRRWRISAIRPCNEFCGTGRLYAEFLLWSDDHHFITSHFKSPFDGDGVRKSPVYIRLAVHQNGTHCPWHGAGCPQDVHEPVFILFFGQENRSACMTVCAAVFHLCFRR